MIYRIVILQMFDWYSICILKKTHFDFNLCVHSAHFQKISELNYLTKGEGIADS